MKKPKAPSYGEMKPNMELDRQIAFSLAWLTTNKKYSFSYFRKNQVREELQARQKLSELLLELSKLTWMKVFAKRRDEPCGTEPIPYRSLSFQANQDLPRDTDALSFRFGGGRYRMLAVKTSKNLDSDRLYIIGYDFDFSAYDHG